MLRAHLAMGVLAVAAVCGACTEPDEREAFLTWPGFGGTVDGYDVTCRDGDRFILVATYDEPASLDEEVVGGVLLDLPADAPRDVVVRGRQGVALTPTVAAPRGGPACDWAFSGPAMVFAWWVFGGVAAADGVQEIDVTVHFAERSPSCVRGTVAFTATGAIPGLWSPGHVSGYGPFTEDGCAR